MRVFPPLPVAAACVLGCLWAPDDVSSPGPAGARRAAWAEDDGDPSAGSAERALAGLRSSDPARRRAALAELLVAARQHPALAARALPDLKDVLRMRGTLERAAAARALLALPGEEALTLWWRLLCDPEEDGRVLACAVESAGERRGDRAFLRALVEGSGAGQASAQARALALESLGALGDQAARVRLGLARIGADWVEEACRALGLARLGGLDGVAPLIALLDHSDRAVRVHAWEGLTRLTGQRFPVERAPWEAWWREHGAHAAPSGPPPAAPAAPADRYDPPPPVHVPHFYGVPLPRGGSGHHVAFCLDVSQSMYGEPLTRSRRELERTLKELVLSDRFDVVAFNENALPWAGRLVAAHPVQKARAIEWFRTLEPTSYTNLYDAVELAYGLAGRGRRAVEHPERLDGIFLLSDGAPNRGRHLQPGPILKALTELSRPQPTSQRIPVHTIGAGEEAFDLLQQIAQATGGTFTDAF